MIHPEEESLNAQIPRSTSTKIVFPYDKQAKKFDTRGYLPAHTQDRLTFQDVEQFLEQVNVPIRKWHKDFGHLYEESFSFCFVFVICFLFFPLLFFLIGYLLWAQAKSKKELREAKEKAKIFVIENNPRFLEKGLVWTIPVHFPQWIELLTNAEGAVPGISIMAHSKPEIHTISIAQKEYKKKEASNDIQEYCFNA